MKKLTTIAASAAITASFVAGSAVAAESPFSMQPLTSGYTVATLDDVCPEGKCGADKGKEAKCGGEKT